MSWNHIESGRPSRSLEVEPEVGLGEGPEDTGEDGNRQSPGGWRVPGPWASPTLPICSPRTRSSCFSTHLS